MEWTCENCNTVKSETGTAFKDKKVCITCFFILQKEDLEYNQKLHNMSQNLNEEKQQHRSNIVNVAHYSGWAVDEFIEAQELGFRLGNVVKYVARAGKKDASKEIEDLEKARAYLSREILRRRQKKELPDEAEKK